jgi:hypothetical protein
MDRDEVPFLEPPLGGFSQAQKFELPIHESRFHFRKHIHNTRGITGSCRTQILRSSADWSSNIETEVFPSVSNSKSLRLLLTCSLMTALYSECLH